MPTLETNRFAFALLMVLNMFAFGPLRPIKAVEFVGEVVDSLTGESLPARVYIEDSAGKWHFVRSASSEGSALPYHEEWVPIQGSVDKHTTISAHPFLADLAPGEYSVVIERGKEYVPRSASVVIKNASVRMDFPIHRWVNMADRGWFSGETHVHRRIHELPNVMLAEDLNVAFPVAFWTTKAFEAPGLEPSLLRGQGRSPFGARADRGYAPILIDPTHVIFPRNTEYEIFSVRGQGHTLGAVFILNHRTAFRSGSPPIGEIAAQAHREGALLDLDKHNWPWSMMLVPIAKVDLFELANNSVWRTQFGFRRSPIQPADYMDVETDSDGMSEWGWLNFGFENYYTLLNCGFHLQPTAGTASGVHPVPLGHSRVYVHTGDRFDGTAWIEGLRRGRSFVTTGPMLLAKLNGTHPGENIKHSNRYDLHIESISEQPVDRIEVIVNGRIVETFRPMAKEASPSAPHTLQRDVVLSIDETSWIAVRSFQISADRRVRFAHTAPWHITIADQPIRPRREEVEYLIERVQNEIERNEQILPEEAISEFREALQIYQRILERARPDEVRR